MFKSTQAAFGKCPGVVTHYVWMFYFVQKKKVFPWKYKNMLAFINTQFALDWLDLTLLTEVGLSHTGET